MWWRLRTDHSHHPCRQNTEGVAKGWEERRKDWLRIYKQTRRVFVQEMSVGAGPGLSLYSISCWVGYAPTSQLVLIPLIHRVTSLRYVTSPGFHTTSNTNINKVLFITRRRLIIVLLLLSFFTIKFFKQFRLKIIYFF